MLIDLLFISESIFTNFTFLATYIFSVYLCFRLNLLLHQPFLIDFPKDSTISDLFLLILIRFNYLKFCLCSILYSFALILPSKYFFKFINFFSLANNFIFTVCLALKILIISKIKLKSKIIMKQTNKHNKILT